MMEMFTAQIVRGVELSVHLSTKALFFVCSLIDAAKNVRLTTPLESVLKYNKTKKVSGFLTARSVGSNKHTPAKTTLDQVNGRGGCANPVAIHHKINLSVTKSGFITNLENPQITVVSTGILRLMTLKTATLGVAL
jgi:hypothetical protein